jgi:TonB family protein
MQVSSKPTSYCLERSAFLNQNDVTSAAIDTTADSPTLVKLTLNEAAARRWKDKSGKSIGLQIGIIVDGRLRSVPTIAAQTATAHVSGLTREEAVSMVQSFQSGTVAKTSPDLPAGDYTLPKPLDMMPFLISKREPEYTTEARAARIEGTVVLELVIRTDGIPDNIRVLRSLNPGLDANAVECVRAWRFRPGRRDGQAVPVKATMEVNFRL